MFVDTFDLVLCFTVGALFGLFVGHFLGMIRGYSDAEKQMEGTNNDAG